MSSISLLKEFVDLLVNRTLVTENKQELINQGFPPIVATIFFEEFGNKAHLFARWFKEYHNYSKAADDRWWSLNMGGYSRNEITLADLIYLHSKAVAGDPNAFLDARRELDLAEDPDRSMTFSRHRRTREEILETLDLAETAASLKAAIKEKLLADVFFSKVLIKAILSGELTDLKPYVKLSLNDATEKFEKKKITTGTPVKVYPNGWKWLNVGPKCELVGNKMKNCGSAGVMSWDSAKTMVVLFDKGNKPHVVTTWSPTEKRLSGAEGVASTPPKESYEDYILDLAKTLGARIDWEKSKSKTLALKALFTAENVASIKSLGGYFPNYQITFKNGETWFTDGYGFIPQAEVQKAMPNYENNLSIAVARMLGADRNNYKDVTLLGMEMADRLGTEYYRFLS